MQVVNSQLTLDNIGGCFIILAIGICLAIISSISTIITKNMKSFSVNKKH